MQRTQSQNNALHLYLSQVAETLAREGHTMQDVTKAIRRAEIRPTMAALKEVVWRPLMEIIHAKKSTTELTTREIDQVFDIICKHLGEKFGITIEFPSIETLINKSRSSV